MSALRALQFLLTPTTTAIRVGKLLPDSTIIPLVRSRLASSDCTHSWVLDGVPRTASQAEALLNHEVTKPDLAIELCVPYDDIRQRLLYRRNDPVTGRVYNLKTSPPPAHVLHRLEKREDDTEETLEKRFATYDANMPAVWQTLREGGVKVIQVEIEPGQGVEEVHEQVKEVVSEGKVVLAGAPGCGKGTQGRILARVLGGGHVSTGDLLREEMRREQEVVEGLTQWGVGREVQRALA